LEWLTLLQVAKKDKTGRKVKSVIRFLERVNLPTLSFDNQKEEAL
jgi:hypothetical protein